jgi:hypothetical protein
MMALMSAFLIAFFSLALSSIFSFLGFHLVLMLFFSWISAACFIGIPSE